MARRIQSEGHDVLVTTNIVKFFMPYEIEELAAINKEKKLYNITGLRAFGPAPWLRHWVSSLTLSDYGSGVIVLSVVLGKPIFRTHFFAYYIPDDFEQYSECIIHFVASSHYWNALYPTCR